MKSPAELKAMLRRQWEAPATRETRLLGGSDAWPIIASIGRPAPKVMASDLDCVKRHIDQWRQIAVGEVVWEPVSYRATANPVDVPLYWKLRQPTEWIDACADRQMREEFSSLAHFVEQADDCSHPLLVRRRSLWRDKPLLEVLQAVRLASALEPRCAQGKPLRALSLEGIDTKFFERNARLITALLDARFDGEVSRMGLEVFLGAISERDHWLLVFDLDGSLLPFHKQRIRSSELRETQVPGKYFLVVENESCQHQLPRARGTVAVLGAGLNLVWLEGCWLQDKRVAYWGDIDTWGLQMLATARKALPQLDSMLMTVDIYEQHIASAIPEPIVAGTDVPNGLNVAESLLYERLLTESRGRLEQEFLPERIVHEAIRRWLSL